jgi:hypothetical protein
MHSENNRSLTRKKIEIKEGKNRKEKESKYTESGGRDGNYTGSEFQAVCQL